MPNLSEEQKGFIETVNATVEETVKKDIGAFKEDIDKKMSGMEETIKNAPNSEVIEKLSKDLEEVKSNVSEIYKKSSQSIQMGQNTGLGEIVDSILDNENYKSFAEGKGTRKTGKMQFDLKGTVSLENNYEGTILISQQSNVVVSHPQPRKVNLRDIITNTKGDPLYPSITFTKITDLDRNVAMVSENGRLSESAFKAKEETYNTKRIGTYIPISRRMLKSRTYMRSWLLTNLPKWIRQSEDFQILKGDGNGDNLLGITMECPDFKDVLTESIIGDAGSIKALETYDTNKKTIVEFTDPMPLINNGMNITFDGFDNAAYNATFQVNKINDRKIMIEVAYTAQTDIQVAAASFTAGSEFAKTVEIPNEADALVAAQKYLTYSIYSPNGIALNPIDVFRIQTLKNTLGDQLRSNISIVNGITYVGSLPIIETTAVLPGEVIMGDFATAAELVDYTSLEVEFAEDVETKLTNQVVLIAQGEVIFPVYNPFAFLKFKFSDVLTLLEK